MAETQTHEAVALALLHLVAMAEDKNVSPGGGTARRPDRQWLLDTYGECLAAVKGQRKRTMVGPA